MLPILFSLGDLHIYSYPLFMGIAWGIGFHLSRSLLKISDRNFSYLFWGSFLSSWLGAKAFFLLSTPEVSTSTSFWFGGGFVFYGGIIAGLIFLILLGHFNKEINLKDMGILSIPICFSQGLGRLGCFLAGCCFGNDSTLPWAVHLHDKFRHPVQIYEALGLFILGYLLWKSRKNNLFVTYFIGYGVLRFLLEFLRGDEIRGITSWGLSYSQIVSMVLITLGLIFWIREKIKPRQLPLP